MKLRALRRYAANHFKPCLRDLLRWRWAAYTRGLQALQRTAYTNLFGSPNPKDPSP